MLMMRQTVLCVDNDSPFRDILTQHLEARGYCVLTATDGESALERLIKENPDAVVTDIDMPGEAGLQILEWAEQLAPDIPLIVCSGGQSMEDVAKALCRGAWGCVPRDTTSLDDLTACLARTLRQARLKRQVGNRTTATKPSRVGT